MPKVKRGRRKFMLTRRPNKKKEEIAETSDPTTSSTKSKKRISFEPETANISNFFLGGEDGKEQTYKVHWKDFPLRSPTDVFAHQISAVMIYLFWWKTFTEFNEFEEIAKRRPLTAKEQETEAEHARSIQNYKKLIEMGEEFSAGYGDL
ncbi:hypothetical protein CRE_26668 [Caenorhabditis remanei]|uniref:Chromo domain-containing protein n=1 Tax=Caenorhabditis remanei TaxID=31234 RepID=E3MKV5_CAERE|nr:hypothetical protein CRE_26668 [Caenorhabditis remanei]